MSPRQSASADLAALHEEEARLTPIVESLAERLVALDKMRHQISLQFSAAWQRRDSARRRIMILEQKVKQCRPVVGERKPGKEKTAEDVLAALTPEQKAALRSLLEKQMAAAQKGGA